MDGRPATPDDIDAVTNTLSAAFFNDPVWSWAFPDAARRKEQFPPWWRRLVAQGVANNSAWTTPGYEAATIWVPPGETELNQQDIDAEPALVIELLGEEQGNKVNEMLNRFEAAHPHDEPHWYLSMVGTHPEHRGNGFGVALIAQNLEGIDERHEPAYLESSNPVNHARYERLGFEPIAPFNTGSGGPDVLAMWRPAR